MPGSRAMVPAVNLSMKSARPWFAGHAELADTTQVPIMLTKLLARKTRYFEFQVCPKVLRSRKSSSAREAARLRPVGGRSKKTMQDPVKELPSIINQLLQAPADRQRKLIERYFTPDCKITHALVLGKDREEIIRIFQYWRFANVHLSADVQDIFISAEGDKVFVQLVQHVSHYMHGPIGFDLGMSTILYLRDTPTGKKIYRQVDLHQFESILYHWPLVGPLLELFVRRPLSWSMINTARVASWAYSKLEALYAPDGQSPYSVSGLQERGPLEQAGRWLSKVWWSQRHSWKAEPTVPYNMR